jgi:DNA-binding transcriptional LysR family regulator
MNYGQIDLNLLVVFDTVMDELNTTRAAERLSMTQPAVSNALKRLRHVLGEQLFVKVPSGVSPTAKAVEIWSPIRAALAQIRQTLDPQSFELAKSILMFTVVVTDYLATSTVSFVLPKVLKRLEEYAPNINLRFITSKNTKAAKFLEQGDADMALGVFPNPEERLRTHTLLKEEYKCVMRTDHPLADRKLTLENYVDAKHLLVSLTGDTTDYVDRILEEEGLKRKISLIIAQHSAAPICIANSDLIGTLASRIASSSGLEDKLCFVNPPIELRPMPVKLMWHERNEQNLAHKWLRELLIEVCI